MWCWKGIETFLASDWWKDFKAQQYLFICDKANVYSRLMMTKPFICSYTGYIISRTGRALYPSPYNLFCRSKKQMKVSSTGYQTLLHIWRPSSPHLVWLQLKDILVGVCMWGGCRVIVNFPPWEETREALAYQGTPYSLPPPHTLYSYSYFHLWRCFSLGSQATLFMMMTESGGWAKFFCRGGGAVRFHCKCDRWYNIPL